jgi:hypothetical protein
MRNRDIFTVKIRSGDSPCWKNLLEVMGIYLTGRKVTLKKGNLIRFWIYYWLNNTPLNVSHSMLFTISMVPDATFEEVVQSHFNIPFRRRFSPDILADWIWIKYEIAHMVRLYDEDEVSWSLAPEVFTTKSVYELLENGIAGPNNKNLWKAKLPPKIKVFMWQVYQDAIL